MVRRVPQDGVAEKEDPAMSSDVDERLDWFRLVNGRHLFLRWSVRRHSKGDPWNEDFGVALNAEPNGEITYLIPTSRDTYVVADDR